MELRNDLTTTLPRDVYKEHVLREIRSCLWVRQRWHMAHTDRVETAHRNWFSFAWARIRGHFRRVFSDLDHEAEMRFDQLSQRFDYLYFRLHRPQDRDLLARLIARRALDAESVPLLNVRTERSRLRKLDRDVAAHGGSDVLQDRGWTMPLMDISRYGLPIKFFANGIVLMYSFVRRQYECPEVGFCAGDGDHVIDAGACYGDNALTFAAQVGETGHVYTFEMTSENLAVMDENLARNPDLADRITVIPHPLGAEDGEVLALQPGRAGASVKSMDGENDSAGSGERVTAVTIDALVETGKIDRVDLIKMDIEGAEVPALRGARTTIQEKRPRLAICIYHLEDDFETIPRLIDTYGRDYQFAIGHHSGALLETVLYCY